ncbi:hypothetical protein BJ165DRAFT_1480460 [Panaeolus papilionaceus]|nr:hypothetical protein BJ165DRAFT_1480460 [Panaeolus papilionaceus]
MSTMFKVGNRNELKKLRAEEASAYNTSWIRAENVAPSIGKRKPDAAMSSGSLTLSVSCRRCVSDAKGRICSRDFALLGSVLSTNFSRFAFFAMRERTRGGRSRQVQIFRSWWQVEEANLSKNGQNEGALWGHTAGSLVQESLHEIAILRNVGDIRRRR